MSNFKPVKGVAYSFPIALINSTTTTALVAAPTLSAGNFQISKDGGAFANLATLPTVTPSGGVQVIVSLSATEMTADNIGILINVTGAAQQFISIQTKDPSFGYFPFLMRDTSGNPKTGATVTGYYQADNGTFSALGGAITEIGNGYYYTTGLTLAVMSSYASALNLRFVASGCMDSDITLTNAY